MRFSLETSDWAAQQVLNLPVVVAYTGTAACPIRADSSINAFLIAYQYDSV